MSDDLISRQAAIDAIYHHFPDKTREECAMVLHEVPSAEPEENCDTCIHGYFGDSQCDNCRVGYPSHYERRTDEHSS